MKRENWLILILAVVFIFPMACAKKQVVVPSAVSEQPAAPKAEAEKAITVTGEKEEGVVEGPEEKISEEELAKQEKMKREEILKQEIASFENEDIYFDFDKYNIRPDAAEVLKRKAEWLKQHPNVHILIEGHCDEWGSEEYNLALGERRANSTREFLINLGVNPECVSTISYGEERPTVVPPAYCENVRQFLFNRGLRPNHAPVSVTGTKITLEMINTCESAWAKNRRCHFVVVKY
ncbi:MAG: OmpA family protein [Candidatus Desulfofervidaceae bacterium]|nr:OmpA family protein [Candidatus Desulfofervidaceae bacterium]